MRQIASLSPCQILENETIVRLDIYNATQFMSTTQQGPTMTPPAWCALQYQNGTLTEALVHRSYPRDHVGRLFPGDLVAKPRYGQGKSNYSAKERG